MFLFSKRSNNSLSYSFDQDLFLCLSAPYLHSFAVFPLPFYSQNFSRHKKAPVIWLDKPRWDDIMDTEKALLQAVQPEKQFTKSNL